MKSFAIFFEQYHLKVYNFCLPILQNSKLSQELVQEVMLNIWKLGAELQGIKNIDAFLRQQSRNKAIDFLRIQQSRKRADQQFISLVDIGTYQAFNDTKRRAYEHKNS